MQVLNAHGLRGGGGGGDQPFIDKNLSKAFMQKVKTKNLYIISILLNWAKPSTKRNICVTLLTKEKKKYYTNLDLKIFEENKKNLAKYKIFIFK